MRIMDPDPGMASLQPRQPDEPVIGTVSGWYRGEYDRIYYCVTLDTALDLDTRAEVVTTVAESATDQVPQPGHRRTNRLHMWDGIDLADPPYETLGPELLEKGRAEAGIVVMVFPDPVPVDISLSEYQEDDRRPLVEKNFVTLGYADVELI